MKRRRIAIVGYFGHRNTGDEAILRCMLKRLRALEAQHPELELVVFSGHPDETRRTQGVDAVASVIPASAADALRHIRGIGLARFMQANLAFLRSEIFVVGGGGLFFDTPGSNRYLRELLARMRGAQRLGKRVVAFSVGVGPLHLEESRALLRDTFARCELILARDPESIAELERAGVPAASVRLTGDCAYLLEVENQPAIERILVRESVPASGRPRIGVCLCKEQTESPRVRGALIRFCRHLIEPLDAELCFIPMQTLRGFDDRAAAESVAEQLGRPDRVAVVRGEYNAWEIFGLLGRMDAVVSMRLHGVIFALAQALPVLGISYMPKVERVFREIGHLDWQVPLEGLSGDGLISAFTPIFADRTAVREELLRVRDALRRGALENFRLFEEHFFPGTG